MVYVYNASSVAAVMCVLSIVGASFVSVTTIVNVSVSVAPAPSVAVTVTVWDPTSSFRGVPDRVAVPSPLSVMDRKLVCVEGALLTLNVIAIVSPASTSEVVIE